ncbi:MAG TPA: hypothetical protein DHU55_06465 [Blastocatellia bacterium]|nr:hypothetical protein [Blastocatellia bacterium]
MLDLFRHRGSRRDAIAEKRVHEVFLRNTLSEVLIQTPPASGNGCDCEKVRQGARSYPLFF